MAKKLWGGRFAKKSDLLAEKFSKSIHYDYKLAKYDIEGSIIHVAILKSAGYLSASEAGKLTKALGSIHKSIKSNTFKPDPSSEDIHTDIQNKLQAKTGNAALKLHTARSRNEQVLFSTKLYSKDMIKKIASEEGELVDALVKLAGRNKGMIIPAFTHLQHAQPVYLKDYLYAYCEMLKRDIVRIGAVLNNIKLTMGAGALAGTPIDVKFYSKKVEPTVNSLDAVSDRDFVIDILSALSIAGMHLSRLAEDLIIWSTKEFDFIEIDDAFCTGSSLMPQKKNADVLELIRGYAGRLYGNLTSALVMMKGLPLAYNRDMQLDKEPLFNSIEVISDELKLMSGIINTLKFNKAKIEEHLEDEGLYATDLVYHLVGKGVAFKEAHTIIGRLIKFASDNRIEIKSMTDKELARFSDKLTRKNVIRLLNPKVSVESKRSIKR